MSNSMNDMPKNPASHLHVLNLIVALCAGLISIVGGIYSLKANFFTPKTGTLQGIVRDESIAKPLWLAPVEISEPDGSVAATVSTGQDGRYSLSSLREGEYIVKVSAPRHKVQSKEVKIYSNTATTVNFDLLPGEQKSFSPREQLETPGSIPNTYNPPPAPDYEAQPAGLPDSSDTQAPRRRFRRQASRPGWNSQPSEQSTSPSEPYSDTTQTSQPVNPLRDVITQTLGQMVQDWTSKKTGK